MMSWSNSAYKHAATLTGSKHITYVMCLIPGTIPADLTGIGGRSEYEKVCET